LQAQIGTVDVRSTNPTLSSVFIRGQEVPLVSRETLLRDRYMNLDENARTYAAPRP
jgi:hypothetical protein